MVARSLCPSERSRHEEAKSQTSKMEFLEELANRRKELVASLQATQTSLLLPTTPASESPTA